MKIHHRVAVTAFASLAFGMPLAAQVPVFLPEFPIVENDTVYRGLTGIVMSPSGEFVVVWGQDNGGASEQDVMGRRFDALTVPLGDPAPLTGAVLGLLRLREQSRFG